MNSNQDHAAVESRDSEAEFDPFKPVDERSRGAGIAWLALVLALALLAWNGWQWWQARQQAAAAGLAGAQTAALGARLDASQQRLAALERAIEDSRALGTRLEQLESLSRTSALDETAVQAALDEARGELRDLRQGLEENQATLAALAVREESPGQRVELSEVAFLLRAANERLVLFADIAGAERALALADAQLAALEDPLYLPVRQAIASARLSLESAPRVDLVALTGRIDQLQSVVPQLPLKGENPPPAVAEPPAATGTEAPSLWTRFKQTLAGLVTVRRRVEAEPLFSLADKDYLRQGLWLQLESARLALLRSDPAAWRASLERASGTLATWFDGADAETQRAGNDIAVLQEADLGAALPDISGPWRALNRLQAAPSPLPVEPPASEGSASPAGDAAG